MLSSQSERQKRTGPLHLLERPFTRWTTSHGWKDAYGANWVHAVHTAKTEEIAHARPIFGDLVLTGLGHQVEPGNVIRVRLCQVAPPIHDHTQDIEVVDTHIYEAC
jgi:hypothetical protein